MATRESDRKRWKESERQIARRLGGERVPVTGRGRGDAPDIRHSSLAIEVKHRTQPWPKWLTEALAQAEASATVGQKPIAILHRKGQPYSDSLVVMDLTTLIALLGDKED